ncbi:FAD/NAD(P)-binding domain-containing protein [Agrocybe pediades]|nr:FAD/NAD(P)-binding domain-containing protein [Agrocybe pediades]
MPSKEITKETPPTYARTANFCPLDIAIVGAGVAGLVAGYLLGRAGHRVTLFDSASELGEVGAGIQLTPNVTRLLIRWGVGERLRKVGVVPPTFSLRRYATGEVIGWRKWGNSMERDYGAPYCLAHRADLHRILLDLAKPYVLIRLNSTVVDINPSIPTLTLSSGEVVRTQMIIGADGIHSRVRNVVVGSIDRPEPTGDAAYRAVVPSSELLKDPDLAPFVEDGTNIWMGPKRHLVTYPLRNKELYNIVMAYPSPSTDEVTRPVDPAIMRNDFIDFEPRARKLLALIKATSSWALMDHKPLDNWVHKDGKVCLLGDACHPMLPYRAQGAAMAIEDGAALGNLFSRITHPSQIGKMLWAYQEIRHPRATAAQLESRMNQRIFHLPDGPEQEARDESMRQATVAAIKEANGEPADDCVGSQNQWADKQKNDRVFGYDIDAEVDKWWKEHESDFNLLKAKM